jgi:CO/xanthine dehydrogenase Mo-binding subunit
MGLGHTLTEEFLLKDGWPITDSLTSYFIPSILDVPMEISSTFIEPSSTEDNNVSKGMAELVLVPVAPAIINAIYDAVGVYINELPATPERVLLALNNKRME